MSHADILAELPKLTAQERSLLLDRLCELQEVDLIQSNGVTDEEKRILDEALAEFAIDGSPGTPWREVLQRVRSSGVR